MSKIDAKPASDGVSIVAVGSFNPAIFQPLWFSKHKLIREEEAAESKIQLIHPSASVFSTDWFFLQAYPERFSLDSTDPSNWRALRDLAVGTFTILEHTPITSFGFNRMQHFPMPSEKEWHAFGHYFAPKPTWKKFLSEPGMLSLTVQGKREKCDALRVQVKVEPSLQCHPGVFLQVNQHYGPPLGEIDPKERACDYLPKFLNASKDDWESFLEYTNGVAVQLFNDFQEQSSHESS